jgi:hypothetical protein
MKLPPFLCRPGCRARRPLLVGALTALLALLAPMAVGPLRAAGIPGAETDGEVAAREVALELAGAFSNDGYKIRDGHYSGQLQPHVPRIVVVNLYAGNQYYFSLGATDKAKKVAVTVYDETGKEVDGEQLFAQGARAAAGVSPIASGPYYAKVELLEGEPADFCLIYSYK